MNLGRSLHFFCVRHPWRTPKLHRYFAILAALRVGKPFREHPSSIPLRFLTL
jgi:hypothetical protein